MSGALAWFGVGLWLVLLFSAGWYSRGRWERRAQARRRGGYVKPPASAHTKAHGRATPATGITARISSYSARGSLWEDTAYRRKLRRVSRRGAPTVSGDVTAARGGSGERRAPAGYGSAVTW